MAEEKEERRRQTEMLQQLLKVSESTSKEAKEIKEARVQDLEKARKEREESANLVGELRNDMEDLKRNAVGRDEINSLVRQLAEEQTRRTQTMAAWDQAWAKRSASEYDGIQTTMDGLRRQIGELKGELEHIRSYPEQNENRTSAQILATINQFDAAQRNVLIRGIQEHEDAVKDVELIKEELRNEFRVIAREGRRSVVRNIQRVGKRNEMNRAPRMVKVVFDSLAAREDFMREAREKEWRDSETWKEWKEAHPDNYMDDLPGKPRLRRDVSDTPMVIRNKKREMKEVCQLLTLAGHRGMPKPVMVDSPNGDAKLFLCRRAPGGKWLVEKSGAEAETMITNVLRDHAIRKGWKTRASTSYTQSGAFLPTFDHIAQDQQLKGIFSSEVQWTRRDNLIWEEDVARMQSLVDGAMEEAVRGVGDPEGSGER